MQKEQQQKRNTSSSSPSGVATAMIGGYFSPDLSEVSFGASSETDDRMPLVQPNPNLASQQDINQYSYYLVLKQLAWLAFCASTAIQPALNSMAVGDGFSTGSKCDVGEIDCYDKPAGKAPGLNYALGLFALLANMAVTYFFLPQTYNTIKKMIYPEKETTHSSKSLCNYSRSLAILFASAAAAVSYSLSRDSFKLSSEVVNGILIALSVPPTFASRFTGSHKRIGSLWRVPPLISTFSGEGSNLGWAITIQNHFLRLLYALPVEFRGNIIKNGIDAKILKEFYYGQQNHPESNETWQGLQPSCAGGLAYWGVQAVLAAVSVLSSFIICNVNLNLTGTFLDLQSAVCLAAAFTLPATLYYLYSLNELPDRMIRIHALARAINQPSVWLLYACVYMVGIGSCGNLLYSGRSQGLNGAYDWMGLSRANASILFGIIGGLISALCNLLPLLAIFEDIVKTLYKLTGSVVGYEEVVNKFVKDVKNGRFTNTTISTDNPIQTDNQDDLETGLVSSTSLTSTLQVVKDIYKTLPFFSNSSCCSTGGSYSPVAGY